MYWIKLGDDWINLETVTSVNLVDEDDSIVRIFDMGGEYVEINRGGASHVELEAFLQRLKHH